MKSCKELLEILDEDSRWSTINVYNENLSEMARIGKLPNSQFEIHIEGSEGDIPHFHFQRLNGKKENCICHIKLLSAEYLRDADDPGNTLNTHERKALNDYMHKNSPGLDISNWAIILSRWNEANPKYAVKINQKEIPDYTTITE